MSRFPGTSGSHKRAGQLYISDSLQSGHSGSLMCSRPPLLFRKHHQEGVNDLKCCSMLHLIIADPVLKMLLNSSTSQPLYNSSLSLPPSLRHQLG